MSGLPGMPLPRSAPLFVPREEFLHYLRRYARAFDLPVDTGRHVERMTRTDGTWTVNTSRGVLAARAVVVATGIVANPKDRKSTRLNSSHLVISYAVFCL